MKKRLLLVTVILICLSLVACIILLGCNAKHYGKYYQYQNGVKVEDEYIELTAGGKWIDCGTEKGKYEIDGSRITLYDGDEVYISGTIEDGVLKLDYSIGELVYRSGDASDDRTSFQNNISDDSNASASSNASLRRSDNSSAYTLIDFGKYPQSAVTDSSITEVLTELSGELPTEDDNKDWTSYGFYISGSASNCMWYIDIEEAGEKYRGVYFTSYRPYHTTYSSSTSNSYQDDNGYHTSTVYWFKYEPIKWQIFTKSDGKAFLVADLAIDSKEYYIDYSSRMITTEEGGNKIIYSNNYAYSTIRTWLNETFYNTAFDDLQKNRILTTAVDNSASSTGYSSNSNACDDTSDKVFLLSYTEATTYLIGDSVYMRQSTDYAKSLGIHSSPVSAYLGNCGWWLRSPYNNSSSTALKIFGDGGVGDGDVSGASGGVVPALWVDLDCSMVDREHVSSDWIIDNEATCSKVGSKHKECTVCGNTLETEEIKTLEHNYVDGICSECGEVKEVAYTCDGDVIYFGQYPQSVVTDTSVTDALTALAGTLPTFSNSRSWTSYGYYIEGEASNFMWYIDVENEGKKYRGVYFTSYRPYWTDYISFTGATSYQDDNGYYTSTVYWFKYEPIKWQILTESDGKAFLLADIAIDSQEYYISRDETRTIDGETVYPNNYAYSTIREWLNDTFYNTAFNDLQKELIQTTTVDNSVSSTGYSSNSYACANTSDKVFLLSYTEATTYLTSNSVRIRKSTDYAKSQGIYASTSSGYEGNCWWWLRSPHDSDSDYARYISSVGSVYSSGYVSHSDHGVVPALWIALDCSMADREHVSSDWIIDKEATCSKVGSKHKECTVCGKTLETEEIAKLAHSYTTSVVTEPTCTEQGYTTHTCSCGDSHVDSYVDALGHDEVSHAAQAPTCTEVGWEEYVTCSRCDYTTHKAIEALGHDLRIVTLTESTCTVAGTGKETCSRCDYENTVTLPKSSHNYVGGVCSACGAKKEVAYTRDGDVLYLGTYPQNEVTDTSVTDALTALSGELPTEDDSKGWTSYGYYISGSVSNFMWYIDIENAGEKYRGVYFTSYRPYYTTRNSSTDGSLQDDNGYCTSTVYWFKYEPIKWQILTESDGKALLLADMAIDSQEYHISNSSRTMISSTEEGDEETIYPNNYAYSTIRTWLNETFYNTAFNDLQKELIQTTTVDNSVSSTGYSSNSYACANTSDKVFLLSYTEATTYLSNSARERKSTDYAKSQGCSVSTSNLYLGNCWWRLRSPYGDRSVARYIGDRGGVACVNYVYNNSSGVVPALWIALDDSVVECAHVPSDWIIDAEATCAKEGSKRKECTRCGKILETARIEKIEHGYNESVVTDPTCTKQGYTTHLCICGDGYADTYVDALGHNYVGVCTRCGKEENSQNAYTRDGDVIYFGTYPQSEVMDSTLKSDLTILAGELPIEDDNKNWTSYCYICNGDISHFMWYMDVEYESEKYRGVYFTSYRPYYTTYSSSAGYSYQDDNGYNTKTVYWFKYEPIKWQILTESDGKAFLLADIAIDSQEYYPSSNNYANSTIRMWLNETFYNTAFNDLQKELIQTTTVDNSALSTGYSANFYACDDTRDKVFLLSYTEATTYLTNDSMRIRQSTDYAKSQGCWASTSSGYKGNCWWWLRSPFVYNRCGARGFGSDGSVDSDYNVNDTYSGVVPALRIAL